MPKKNKKSGKKAGSTGPSTSSSLAKKKDPKEHKKNELNQLQDSLSSFFTPTSSRRSRNPPPQPIENTRDSDDSETPSGQSVSEDEDMEQDITVAGPSSSSTSLPPVNNSKKPGCPSTSYPSEIPNEILKNKKRTVKKKGRRPAQEYDNSSSDEEIIPQVGPKRFYYKGFWFADCPNGIIDPNGAGAEDLIKAFKCMEAKNRTKPDFKEYSDVNSDSSYEEYKNTGNDKGRFRDTDDYLNHCKRNQRKKKIRDGLSREQRREHQQFKREFRELLTILEANHLAVCDDEFNEFKQYGSSNDDHNVPNQDRSSFNMDIIKKSLNKYDSDDGPTSNEIIDNYSDNERNGYPISKAELSEFKKKFDMLNFGSTATDDKIFPWRDMLPRKPPRSGRARASSESSRTTDDDLVPKPIDYDIVYKNNRPMEYRKYRSGMSRIMYRRLVRRACRDIVAKDNAKRNMEVNIKMSPKMQKSPPKINKPKTLPRRPSFDENVRDYPLDSDDSNVPEDMKYIGYDDIMNKMKPEWRKMYEEFFDEIKNKTEERLKAVAEAKHPCPKYIHTYKYKIKTLHTGLFPESLQTAEDLYICDLCLQGMLLKRQFEDHKKTCQMLKPPGNEIYCDNEKRISVFEVDALKNPSYCRMLCSWARCYIDHKALWMDIEPFLFYVLVKRDVDGKKNHFVGYFSKQKYQHSQCNLCCLLILPCYQGDGYGRFMVDFSFLLSKVEKVPGTPERPLSDAADVLYYKYYIDTFYETVYRLYFDLSKKGESMKENYKLTLDWLEEKTGINKSDMLKVLVHEKIAEIIYDKKTKSPIDIKFNLNVPKMIDRIKKIKSKKNRIWIKPNLLKWKPSLNNPEELLHFPLIQTEYDVINDAPIIEEVEQVYHLPIQPKKRGRKKKEIKPPIILRRGITVEEFEEKVSDPEIGFSAPFCNKDDAYISIRRPKKGKKKPPMTGKRRRKNKKKAIVQNKSEDELSSGPPFIIEERSPSLKKALHTVSSSERSRPSSPAKRGRKKKSPVKRNCKPEQLDEEITQSSDSENDQSGPSRPRGRPRTLNKQTKSSRGSSPQKKGVEHEAPSRCNVMSIGSPKQKSTPKTKTKGHSSDEETPVQHVRARIRGSSLDSSSDDDDHRRRNPRKRPTSKLKNDIDSATEMNTPVKRSSRHTESALEEEQELQHEETADISFDPYSSYMQVDPYRVPSNKHEETSLQLDVEEDHPPPIEMEVVNNKPQELEMPTLAPTLHEAPAQPMDEDDEDDDAPPLLTRMAEVEPSDNPPQFEVHQRSLSVENESPPVLQQSNVEKMDVALPPQLEMQPVQAQQPIIENLIEPMLNQQSRRSSTEQGYSNINQNPPTLQGPSSSGMQNTNNYPASISHPASAGSLHPASASNMLGNSQGGHTYPNSAGNMNMGTPQMTTNSMHTNPWPDMMYSAAPQQQPQQSVVPPCTDLLPNFSMSLPQPNPSLPQPQMEYPHPEVPKEQTKPKKPAAKKKKKEVIQPPKFPPQNPYEQPGFNSSFLNPYAMAAASANQYYYQNNIGNPATAAPYNQNPMGWNTSTMNYQSFMGNQINQQKFYPSIPNYPMIPNVTPAPPVVTGTNPISSYWQRPPNPTNNPAQGLGFYPYYNYQG